MNIEWQKVKVFSEQGCHLSLTFLQDTGDYMKIFNLKRVSKQKLRPSKFTKMIALQSQEIVRESQNSK